jgi:hypothetical protein
MPYLEIITVLMVQTPENVHALEGLACRKRLRPSRACFGHKTVKADQK